MCGQAAAPVVITEAPATQTIYRAVTEAAHVTSARSLKSLQDNSQPVPQRFALDRACFSANTRES
jgi:hypothetical protein